MNDIIPNKEPICVNFIENSSTYLEEFNPISDDKKTLIYSKIVNFLSRRGYVFDQKFKKYYKLERSGVYEECDEVDIKEEIYTLINVNHPTFNVEFGHIKSILCEFQAKSNLNYLEKKFEDFLATSENGWRYELDYIQKQNGYQIIPVQNGLFNPCLESGDYPFTLLPHCGYYFPPEGTSTYDLEFVPIPESEIYIKSEYDDFLTVLGDKDTLTFFLWWAGTVLFTYPFNLPMFLLLYGPGGTGKTSAVKCVCSILGKSSGFKSLSDFITSRDKACFIGKKLNLCSEMDGKYDKRLISSIKDMTGGTLISVDPKFKSVIDIYPPALVFTGNVFPEIDPSDTGIFRRACVINCTCDLENSGIRWDLLLTNNEHKNWLFNASYYVWSKYRDSTIHDMKSKAMLEAEREMSLSNAFPYWLESLFGTTDRKLVRKKLIGWTLNDLYDEYCACFYDIGARPLAKHNFSSKIKIDYTLILSPVGNKRVFKEKT